MILSSASWQPSTCLEQAIRTCFLEFIAFVEGLFRKLPGQVVNMIALQSRLYEQDAGGTGIGVVSNERRTREIEL